MKKQFLIVTVPVANLRKEPVEASFEYVCDDLQETQLLYNETLLCEDERKDWYYVEAVEQKQTASQGIWQGYPGWIQKTSARFIDTWPAFNTVAKRTQVTILKDSVGHAESLLNLSIGTRFAIGSGGNDEYYETTLTDGRKGWIKKDDVNIPAPVMDRGRLRKNITETAKLFLGMPYLWGGRSAYVPDKARGTGIKTQGTSIQMEDGSRKKEAIGSRATGMYKPRTLNVEHRTVITGVDCSSLTNLAYRVNWLDIPRDAHDQWSTSTHIAYETLAPADLIFVSAEETHDKITHVMIYLTGEEFIEASETGSVVTINTFKNKFGLTLHEASRQGFIVNKRKMYFGSILIAGEKK